MIKEMTRYGFVEHMRDFIKSLIKDPINSETDSFLNHFGIDGPVALKMLLKRTDPNDETSAVLIRTERIKDNGYDENGNRNKDTFEVKYKIPRKDFLKKLRNLYINIFESNLVDNPVLNEGAWGYGILDNDAALDYQTEFATVALKVLISKVQNSQDKDSLWANIGVLVDFLKKYKDDEIQVTDEYNEAIDIAKKFLNDMLYSSDFSKEWSEPEKFKSSIKKILKDISLLKYQKEIMNHDAQKLTPGINVQVPKPEERQISGGLMEDGGATTCGDSSGQVEAQPVFPIVRKKMPTNESKTMYITQEQAQYLKEATAGDIGQGFTASVSSGNEDDDFWSDSLNHKNMNRRSWRGK